MSVRRRKIAARLERSGAAGMLAVMMHQNRGNRGPSRMARYLVWRSQRRDA